MARRRHKFADGLLGDALDQLFEASSTHPFELQGRVASICRLIESGGGMDSVHMMVHEELDAIDEVPELQALVRELRGHLVTRKHPPGAMLGKLGR